MDKILLSENILNYLKEDAPIGCLDYSTLELLKECGVESYYSGCLALTLQQSKSARSAIILFVDVL